MNHDTSHHRLPSLVAHVLNDGTHYIDNLFASAWTSLHLNRRLEAAGFAKRSGIEVTETVFVLMVWKWLHVSSIAVFCRSALSLFSRAKKDVLYDFLKREDIHWRKLNLHTARELYRQHALHHSQVRAYVLDDSIKARRGKKMEDVSSHYDHTTNRHVMGQQVLTLGLASEEAFVPLDSQIYVSSKKAQTLNRDHRDRRSIGARRYREATTRTKPQMALGMMRRAKRSGVEADYLVADAWFGTKTMIRAAYELGVCAVLRMKKGAMKYRVSTGGGEPQRLDAKEIFAQQVRKRWRKVRGLPWRAVSVEVELDVSEAKERSSESGAAAVGSAATRLELDTASLDTAFEVIARHLDGDDPLPSDAALASCLGEVARTFRARGGGDSPADVWRERLAALRDLDSSDVSRRAASLTRTGLDLLPAGLRTRAVWAGVGGLLGVAACAAAATVAPVALVALPGWAATGAGVGSLLSLVRRDDDGTGSGQEAASAGPPSDVPRRMGETVFAAAASAVLWWSQGADEARTTRALEALAPDDALPALDDADEARLWLAAARHRVVAAARGDA